MKELFKQMKENNRKIRATKRKLKVLDKIIKLTKKYDLELTRTEIQGKKVLLIYGIMEDKQC